MEECELRVISGSAKGHKLRSIKGFGVRPTADRVKESLFNMISSYINASNVLDLFAGTGSLGIEALSRGASHADFVEEDNKAIDLIKQNLTHTKLIDRASIYAMDCNNYLNSKKATGKKYNIIFMDPPYNKNFIISIIENISKNNILASDGIIVIERNIKDSIAFDDKAFILYKERKYGDTAITILKKVNI